MLRIPDVEEALGETEFLDVWDDSYAAIMRYSRAGDGFWVGSSLNTLLSPAETFVSINQFTSRMGTRPTTQSTHSLRFGLVFKF
jgi:hypothetical protein